MLVPNTNTRARCTGDDECAPKTRDSTRRRCTAGSKRHVDRRACSLLTYMYNDDPLRQRRPHTRTSQVTKVTHTQTLLHSKAGRAGRISLRGGRRRALTQWGRSRQYINRKIMVHGPYDYSTRVIQAQNTRSHARQRLRRVAPRLDAPGGQEPGDEHHPARSTCVDALVLRSSPLGADMGLRGAEQVPDAVGDRARHLVVRKRWLCRARVFSGGSTRSKREVQPMGLRHPNAWRGAALVDARARLPGYGMPRGTRKS